MTRRILSLLFTLAVLALVLVRALTRSPLTGGDLALVTSLGFCLGIDVCRIIIQRRYVERRR